MRVVAGGGEGGGRTKVGVGLCGGEGGGRAVRGEGKVVAVVVRVSGAELCGGEGGVVR